MSNRNFSYIFSPSLLWGNVSSLSVTGLGHLVTKTLYYQINEWSSCYNIELPDINKSCISYGILPCNESNILQNVLILLFKKLVYNCKNNIKMLRLETFIASVKNLEKLEYRIALQKGKLSKHQTKWKLLSNID